MDPARTDRRADAEAPRHLRFVKAAQSKKAFMERIVTCDENRILYDNRGRPAQWLYKNECPKEMPRSSPHPKKTMAIVWWTMAGTIDRVANHTDELITEIRVTLNGTTVVVTQLGDAVTVLLDQLYQLIFWTLIIVIPVLCLAIVLCSAACLIRSCRRPVRYIPHYREIPLVREDYNSSKIFRSTDLEI